jgi:hypothetical protein
MKQPAVYMQNEHIGDALYICITSNQLVSKALARHWIPAYAGMTESYIKY